MQRLRKSTYINNNFLASKLLNFKPIVVKLSSIKFIAGHYQLNSLYAEHGLIFSEVVGQTPMLQLHTHGKRKKLTLSLNSSISKNNIFSTLDKIIHILIASLEDFQIPVVKKVSPNYGQVYTWHFRKYFDYSDSNKFISERLVLKKDIFMPASLQLSMLKSSSHSVNETYFRMLRLPFTFYKLIK